MSKIMSNKNVKELITSANIVKRPENASHSAQLAVDFAAINRGNLEDAFCNLYDTDREALLDFVRSHYGEAADELIKELTKGKKPRHVCRKIVEFTKPENYADYIEQVYDKLPQYVTSGLRAVANHRLQVIKSDLGDSWWSPDYMGMNIDYQNQLANERKDSGLESGQVYVDDVGNKFTIMFVDEDSVTFHLDRASSSLPSMDKEVSRKGFEESMKKNHLQLTSSRNPIKSSVEVYNFNYEDENGFDVTAFTGIRNGDFFEVTDKNSSYSDVRIGDMLSDDDVANLGLEPVEIPSSEFIQSDFNPKTSYADMYPTLKELESHIEESLADTMEPVIVNDPQGPGKLKLQAYGPAGSGISGLKFMVTDLETGHEAPLEAISDLVLQQIAKQLTYESFYGKFKSVTSSHKPIKSGFRRLFAPVKKGKAVIVTYGSDTTPLLVAPKAFWENIGKTCEGEYGMGTWGGLDYSSDLMDTISVASDELDDRRSIDEEDFEYEVTYEGDETFNDLLNSNWITSSHRPIKSFAELDAELMISSGKVAKFNGYSLTYLRGLPIISNNKQRWVGNQGESLTTLAIREGIYSALESKESIVSAVKNWIKSVAETATSTDATKVKQELTKRLHNEDAARDIAYNWLKLRNISEFKDKMEEKARTQARMGRKGVIRKIVETGRLDDLVKVLKNI